MRDYVYTIGREFGSDGKNVGFALAEKLGINCYDKELLTEAAKQSGFCEEIFENIHWLWIPIRSMAIHLHRFWICH